MISFNVNKPRISIITITYNSEKTLEETIKSIASQNYDNLEYIIVDGGSTDRTLEITEKYKDVITKIISEPDEGISDAFNKGIAMAEGDIVGIINSDDMLYDNALSELAEAYDEKTDIYYGNALICDEEGKASHILTSTQDLSAMPYSFCIVHPATFVTKKAYDKYGTFRKELRCAMDYDLLLRFYKAGANFKYIDKTLSVYRMGGTNMKMQNITIKEVRDISVYHGGNVIIANMLLIKSKLRAKLKFIKVASRRVKKL